MTWAKFDDQMPFHFKVIAAGNEAVGAWVRMVCWSCGARTNGFVPTHTALAIAGKQKVIDSLLEPTAPSSHGLLKSADGGFVLHDFEQFNPTADQATERREQALEARRIAGKAGGKRSAEARKAKQTASKIEANWQANPSKVQANPQANPSKPEANAKQTPKQTASKVQANGKQNPTPVPDPLVASNEATPPYPPQANDGGGGGGEFDDDSDEPDALTLASDEAEAVLAMSPELTEAGVRPGKLSVTLTGAARLLGATPEAFVAAVRETVEALAAACTSDRHKVGDEKRANWVLGGVRTRLQNPRDPAKGAAPQQRMTFDEINEANKRARILDGIDFDGLDLSPATSEVA